MRQRWTLDQMPALAGKTALVTGANSGLGLETSAELARAGASVIMACRNPGKAKAAMDEVLRRAPKGRVALMSLDLANLASIAEFAKAFSAQQSRLDILCNNAGVMALPYQKTPDGFEMQMGTNHLGHFYLTGLLLEKLKATPGARVVSVASQAHRWGRRFDFEDFHWERKPYLKWIAYGNSKLANLLFTFELQRRFEKAGIDAMAVAAHPGYAATNLGFVGPALQGSALGRAFIQVGNAVFAQPADMGALPSLYAASMPDMRGGDYIGPDRMNQMRGYPIKVQPRRLARDADLAAQLWAHSEKLTGLRYL